MIGPARKAVSAVALGSSARIEVWHMLSDLMEAEMDVERALQVTIRSFEDQGQTLKPWVLKRWRRALIDSRFEEEVALWVPATEGMVLQGHRRVDAKRLFEAAARIAEARSRQMSALWGALAVPGALAAGILVALWLSGAEFVPVMAEIVPISKWEIWSRLFADASTWVYVNGLGLVGGLAGFGGALRLAILNWAGPGRTFADRIPPFSLYRTIAGSSFLFVVIEFLRAGVDLNERTFAQLRASSSRYTRSRILELERRMRAGAGLGRAMVESGYGFPDPSLVAVVAALDGTEGWEDKLAGFVARWARRSEEMLKRRTGVLNGALMTLAAVMMAVAVKGMFGVMSAAGGVGGL